MPVDYIGQNVYIKPTHIVSLPEYSGAFSGRSYYQLAAEKHLKDNSTRGVISHKAEVNIKAAINWLLVSAEPKKVYHKAWQKYFNFKVNFVTLTLPDTHQPVTNAQLQKVLLNPFLTLLRSYHSLKNYVWKIEFQKNGKLHVHLCTDSFVHHNTLRRSWNNIMAKNGLLTRFAQEFGHTNPNSTDVHSVRKIKNLGAYIAKYMAKQNEHLSKVTGRIWGCNQALSKAMNTKVFINRDDCHTALGPLLAGKIEYKQLGSVDKVTGLWRSFGEVFYLTYKNWMHDIRGTIKQTFVEAIAEIRGTISDQKYVYEV